MLQVKVWKEKKVKPQAEHAIKVHEWAGISLRVTSKICIFDQVMDAPLYIGIQREFFLPFIRKQLSGCEYRFMQDNDPKHTSRKGREVFEKGRNKLVAHSSKQCRHRPYRTSVEGVKVLHCLAYQAIDRSLLLEPCVSTKRV